MVTFLRRFDQTWEHGNMGTRQGRPESDTREEAVRKSLWAFFRFFIPANSTIHILPALFVWPMVHDKYTGKVGNIKSGRH